MAIVKPFHGVRYDLSKTGGDLGPLVSPPYDVIRPARQRALYDRHPANFVRIDFAEPHADDVPGQRDVYTRAAATWNDWLAKGILKRDDKPCFYLYRQTFKATLGGLDRTFSRTGLVASVHAEAPGTKYVLPHEQTFSGPKEDRYKLTVATQAFLGQVFLLYQDPQSVVEKATAKVLAAGPWARLTDDDGVEHALYVVDDPAATGAIEQMLADKVCVIADGHHRYETGHRVWGEIDPGGRRHHGVLATLVNTEDPGLVVLPIHRIYQHLPGLSLAHLERKLAARFEITRVAYTGVEAAEALLAPLAQGHHAFAVRWKGAGDLLLLKARRGAFGRFAPYSEDWSQLDVSVLQRVVQEELLGIDPATYAAGTHVVPIKEGPLVMELLDKTPDYQFAALLNPTPVESLPAVTRHGERMPQKSTFFHPKMWSGLVSLPIGG